MGNESLAAYPLLEGLPDIQGKKIAAITPNNDGCS